MLICKPKLTGFTLIEILISLLLGSLLLAMIIGLYISNVGAGMKAMKFSRLRTDLHALVGLIEEDIRRSGYGGEEFLVGSRRDKVFDLMNNNTGKCIVYSYNYDDAMMATASHRMGIRYSQEKQSVQFGRGVDYDVSDCFSSGTWFNLTNPKFIKVTSFDFTENITSNAYMTLRSVEIDIAVELTEDHRYSHQLKTTVRARNIEL